MRKVCVVVHSRANYARIKSAMKAILAHPMLDLQIVLGSSALLPRYGGIKDIIESEVARVSACVHTIIEGDSPATMAKSTGLGIIEMASVFETLTPHVVVTVADRFETMATAIAASYMNIPLAHTQGGEVTGSIDESVRHAITKLAHIHFPATHEAFNNVVRMGEDQRKVFLVGCPAMDLLTCHGMDSPPDLTVAGVGASFPLHRGGYLVVVQHPVTTEYGEGAWQIGQTLKAVVETGLPAVWLWPNIDAGTDGISKVLRKYRENNSNNNIKFLVNMEPEAYARLINNCACLIGNSSSGIREGSFLGVPAVNIGSRQSNRQHGANIVNADYDWRDIMEKTGRQVAHGKYDRDTMFGDGNAGARIASILAGVSLDTEKTLKFTGGC